MIGTEQERDALKRILAVLKPILTDHNPPIAIDWVGKGAIAVGQEFELAINAVREHKDDAAIRAMLAPPDDAVLRERIEKLRSQIAMERFYLHAEDANTMKMQGQQQLILESFARNMEQIFDSQIIPILDAIIALLRGEATRDE